jgi:hypothetical protein
MTKLQVLNLSCTGLNDITLGSLLPAICSLPDLFELYLRNNAFFFEGAKLFFEVFSELQQLKKLDIAHTFFDRSVVSESPGTCILLFASYTQSITPRNNPLELGQADGVNHCRWYGG